MTLPLARHMMVTMESSVAAIRKAERRTIITMRIATYLAFIPTVLIAIAFRNQQFVHLQWWWTTIASLLAFVVSFRLAERMFFKGK